MNQRMETPAQIRADLAAGLGWRAGLLYIAAATLNDPALARPVIRTAVLLDIAADCVEYGGWPPALQQPGAAGDEAAHYWAWARDSGLPDHILAMMGAAYEILTKVAP